jgi:biotin carboxylase
MKTIIFIGLNKSGSSRDAVKAAVQLGLLTVVFTNSAKQIEQREEYPDIHQLFLLDITNLEQLKEHIRLLQRKGNEIVAITSFVDQHVYTASVLADAFCHNYLSTDAIFIMEDKEATRKFFADQSFTPNFVVIKEGTIYPYNSLPDNLKYPVMVKCSKSTGSKDVLFASNEEEFKKNLLKIRTKYHDPTIIIEEYVEGEQYLVEVIVFNEKIFKVAIIEQEITRGKRFIITGYGVLAEVPGDIEENLEPIIQSITSALKIKNGSFHLEIRLSADGWKLIEINPRISGGAMNKMVQTAFGYSIVEETLKILIGDTPSFEKKTNNYVFTQFVIVSRKGLLEKVTGKRRAIESPGVVEVYVKPRRGTVVNPPLSMGHRYAYVIARADSMEEAKRLAKEAAKEIQFHIIEKENG